MKTALDIIKDALSLQQQNPDNPQEIRRAFYKLRLTISNLENKYSDEEARFDEEIRRDDSGQS